MNRLVVGIVIFGNSSYFLDFVVGFENIVRLLVVVVID